MRIAVVGTVVRDTIVRPDGSRIDSLGGIAYSVAVLAALAPRGVRIRPFARLGADLWGPLRRAWSALGTVETDGLVGDPRPDPRNVLTYDRADPERRSERLTGLLPPLTARELEAAADADVTLVNCITGYDCTIEALERVAGAASRLYLDVHSLALGRAADGRRFPHRPADWWQWVTAADVVQCNRSEAATLTGIVADEREGVEGFARRLACRARRPGVVALTLGAGGARAFERRPSGVRAWTQRAPRVEVADPTGAGDAFGAGYCLAWAQGADTGEALRAGVRCGSAACTIAGSPGGDELRAAADRLEATLTRPAAPRSGRQR